MRHEWYPFISAQAKKTYTDWYHRQAATTWPVPFTEQLVPTSYGPTLVRACGPVDAPPVVLLHGITGTSLMWAPNAGAWAASYRVYAIDTINDYGLSVDMKNVLTKNDFMHWLDSLFDTLGLKKFILTGMSYGGWLAGQYALHRPGRIAKLVLIAPGATILHMDLEFLAKSVAFFFFPSTYGLRFSQWLFADGFSHPENFGITLEQYQQTLYMAHSFQKRWFVPLSVISDTEWQRLTMPILYLAGENDKLYSPQQAVTRLHRVAPQAQCHILPHAGHDVTVVQAGEINRLALAFYDMA
jgi:pimeloyl-ACP methyl ester carboxylesterase